MKVFVIVMGSLNIPEYGEMLRLRQLQLQKYKIPHFILIDRESDILEKENVLVIPDCKDYPHPVCNEPNMNINPHMIHRFLVGLRKIDAEDYDLVLRLNASTYCDLPQFFKVLEPFSSREDFYGGPLQFFHVREINRDMRFISGCAIVMGKEIVRQLQQISLSDPILGYHNDDIVLADIVQNFTKSFVDIPLSWYPDMKHSLIRLKQDPRKLDVQVWKQLAKERDGIN